MLMNILTQEFCVKVNLFCTTKKTPKVQKWTAELRINGMSIQNLWLDAGITTVFDSLITSRTNWAPLVFSVMACSLLI